MYIYVDEASWISFKPAVNSTIREIPHEQTISEPPVYPEIIDTTQYFHENSAHSNLAGNLNSISNATDLPNTTDTIVNPKLIYWVNMQSPTPLRADVEVIAVRPYIRFLVTRNVDGHECFKNISDIQSKYVWSAKYQQAMSAAFFEGQLNAVIFVNFHAEYCYKSYILNFSFSVGSSWCKRMYSSVQRCVQKSSRGDFARRWIFA